MSAFRLPDHIHYCEIDGACVFLDLARDTYFSLPPAAGAAFAALAQASASPPKSVPPSAAALAPLLEAGIVVGGPLGRPIAPTSYPGPGRSLVEQARANEAVSIAIFFEAAFALSRARRAIARKDLPAFLRRLAAMRGARAGPTALRDRATARFLSARRFIPVAPNCLSDSLALCLFLRRRAMACDLIIGAKLHPFAAHCWLQDGELILNDALGAARDFQPVLVA